MRIRAGVVVKRVELSLEIVGPLSRETRECRVVAAPLLAMTGDAEIMDEVGGDGRVIGLRDVTSECDGESQSQG